MVIEFGVAKTGRYDIEESDETTEIIERPMGGQTVVYCSGMRNGRKSKILSSVIANKVLEKTAENFKDSSAIKYVSDQINREYAGEVCGNFCMFSADFETRTIVVSRCTNLPVFYYQHSQFNVWDTKTQQIGSGKGIHPVITEIPIISGTVIMMLSEGILNAGQNSGEKTDITDMIQNVIEDSEEMSADQIANLFLSSASAMDENKPQDDMTAIVIKVSNNSAAHARRMLVTSPIPRYRSIFD